MRLFLYASLALATSVPAAAQCLQHEAPVELQPHAAAAAGSRFGASVDIEGDVAVVGAPGGEAAHVFKRDAAGAWSQVDILKPASHPGPGSFGTSVALSEIGLIAVGAPHTVTAVSHLALGSVVTFSPLSATNWSEYYVIVAPAFQPNGQFGWSVSVEGALFDPLVGEPFSSGACGAAYFLSGASMQPLPGPHCGKFGWSVAAEGDLRLVGEPTGSGHVHVYDDSGVALSEITPPAGPCGSGCEFGFSVALGDGRGIAGAPGADRAYVFWPRLFCELYCSAGVSASGCQATLSGAGIPSASAGAGFVLSAANVEGDAFWSAKPTHNPGTGAVVQAQLWHRDPFNTSNQTTSLSDAIEFTVQP